MQAKASSPSDSRSARITVALFLAGFSTFSLLWCVQPLLPHLAEAFVLEPATSALALSAATAPLAVAILAMGALSESVGRKRLMALSLFSAALLHLAGALVPSWWGLVAVRFLEGIALGGAPAVAMAYLAEELPLEHIGGAMGRYIAGTAMGGMLGRVGAGALVEPWGWRGAMGVIGALGLMAAVGFALLLPPSAHFRPRRGGRRLHLAAWRRHLRDPKLARLFLISFLAMGSFVSAYNYVGFYLSAPPYALSAPWVGSLFLVYIFGVLASSVAGRLIARWGRLRSLMMGLATMGSGLALTLVPALPAVVAGVALVTMGFFGTHAVASGWVGQAARGAKAHASALYLFAYYVGASALGWLGGFVWAGQGWSGSVTFALGLVGAAFLAALTLRGASGGRDRRGFGA